MKLIIFSINRLVELKIILNGAVELVSVSDKTHRHQIDYLLNQALTKWDKILDFLSPVVK